MKKRLKGCILAAAMFFIITAKTTAQAAEYRYDDQGRLIRIIYDNGSYVGYQYDKNGNLLEITESRAEVETTPEETGESETGEPDETSESGTGEPEETSESGTGEPDETGGSETERPEETREPETAGPEETREPETAEPEESGESETKRPESEETISHGGDDDSGSSDEAHDDSQPQEGSQTWKSLLTEWLNQSLLRYQQLLQSIWQWLQALMEQ